MAIDAKQARELIRKLSRSKKDSMDTDTFAEYAVRIMKYDAEVLEQAIEELVEDPSPFLPAIGELLTRIKAVRSRMYAEANGSGPWWQTYEAHFSAYACYRLSILSHEDYMRYCVDPEYKQELLEEWNTEYKTEEAGKSWSGAGSTGTPGRFRTA